MALRKSNYLSKFDPEIQNLIIKNKWKTVTYVGIACVALYKAFTTYYNHGALVSAAIVYQSMADNDCAELRNEVRKRVNMFDNKLSESNK